MSLRMPSPMKRPQSSMFLFRRRIPSDVLSKARGRTIRIPVGDRVIEKRVGAKAAEVGFSLGTRDPAEAKAREAAALAHLDKAWDALRNGPKRLTKREAVALSGEIYRDWIESAGDDPGSPELWQQINEVNEDALAGDGGMAFAMIGEKARRREALNSRFGSFADVLLQRHGLEVDDASRQLLIEEVAKAMAQVSKQLGRQANSDFRRDPDADRFPTMPSPAAPEPGPERPQSVPFERLIEGKWREAEAGGGSKRTLSAWRSSFKHLATFLGHDDASRVTKADVIAFKDHRITQGVSLKTIKDSDLSALKAVLGWGAANGHLPLNPATDVTVKLGRNAKKDLGRSKGFTDSEAIMILRDARGHNPSARELPKTTAARRWVPWLLAFSGARVGEVAQLRRSDVFEQAGRWVVRITPEAGSVKTGRTRLVPLHRQVISEGFLKFVEGAPNGHLFVSPKNPADPHGAIAGLVNRLRKAIDEIIPDDVPQPFHAWRHRFTTRARELGLDPSLVRAIVGHAAKDVSDSYGDYTIDAMARAIDAIPDLPVGGPAPLPPSNSENA